jgi:hypothetical protein
VPLALINLGTAAFWSTDRPVGRVRSRLVALGHRAWRSWSVPFVVLGRRLTAGLGPRSIATP